MNTYERIRDLCREKGVTIKKMEQDLGVARGNACKWKDHDPSPTILLKLSEYLNATPNFILYGEKSSEGSDIKQELREIVLALKSSNNLTFDGHELDAFSKQMLITSLENILDVSNKYFLNS